eukprot:scaffold36260_cov56-Isochrysis_galbana.AAC.1
MPRPVPFRASAPLPPAAPEMARPPPVSRAGAASESARRLRRALARRTRARCLRRRPGHRKGRPGGDGQSRRLRGWSTGRRGARLPSGRGGPEIDEPRGREGGWGQTGRSRAGGRAPMIA